VLVLLQRDKEKISLRGIFTNTSYAKDNEQHEQAL
jgi:hypothetical protein